MTGAMMRAMRRVLTVACMGVLLAIGVVHAQEGVGKLPPEQNARYQALIEELRCLVCQNQNIAESNAELAVDLRRQVHEMIVAGQTDAEIMSYLQDRYGDFVLYRPPVTAKTIILWVGPFVLLLLVLGAVWLRVRRGHDDQADRAQSASSPVDRGAVDAVLKKAEAARKNSQT